ncbi:MAG: hypothetical protein N2645_14505 [Clostridia bacterium]|nr:hypothetical protein [Clostridia bacterium]
MKKVISLLLLTCMLLSSTSVFAVYGNQTSFSTTYGVTGTARVWITDDLRGAYSEVSVNSTARLVSMDLYGYTSGTTGRKSSSSYNVTGSVTINTYPGGTVNRVSCNFFVQDSNYGSWSGSLQRSR